MISPDEIRINNWYNYTNQKISVWKRIDAAIMASIFSDTGEYALNDFEGIPITGEILEGFGCEKRSECIWRVYKIDIFKTEGGWLWSEGSKPRKIMYINQLQNIIRDLEGKELELITPLFSSSPLSR